MSELNAFFARASFIAVCVVALACSEDAAGRRTSGISGVSGIAGTAAGSGGASGSSGGVGGGDVGNAGTGTVAGGGGTAGSSVDDDDLSGRSGLVEG